MQFGDVPLNQALGGTLAHAVRLPTGLLKKGHILSAPDIEKLTENNITHVIVALLEPGDMTENTAATRISDHISGDHLTTTEAFTGRVNLHATQNGLITINESAVNALNHKDEAITLATIAQNAIVHKGQLVATVKIIPLAVRGAVVETILTEINRDLITLHPFLPQKAIMVQTELRDTKEKLLEKSKRVMTHRLEIYGASLREEIRCRHEETALADLLTRQAKGDQDMILIMGATAITDRKDVIPAAILRAGGEIIQYGMPVDPGNLMLLAKLAGKWVLGLPGCSRSPKLNGIDLILSRICAGLDVTGADVRGMGVGGLLSEYSGRPQPRDVRAKDRKKKTAAKNIAAIILAAGQSTRMGQDNKLLLPYQDTTVLSHVARQVDQGELAKIYVVTGYQQEKIEQELSGHDVTFIHNDLYDEGMSTSLKLGIGALPPEIDGAIIILGDMPNISTGILQQIIAAYDPARGRSIIIPTCKGKRGNPILWDRAFFEEFDRLEGDRGAKILLSDFPDHIHELDIGSEAVFMDIDTLEAYEQIITG